jgi:hypothetical protein
MRMSERLKHSLTKEDWRTLKISSARGAFAKSAALTLCAPFSQSTFMPRVAPPTDDTTENTPFLLLWRRPVKSNMSRTSPSGGISPSSVHAVRRRELRG